MEHADGFDKITIGEQSVFGCSHSRPNLSGSLPGNCICRKLSYDWLDKREGTMKKIILTLVFTAMTCAASFAGGAKEAIEAGAPEFMATFNSGDSAKLASFYTEDGALFPPGADRVDGREAIAKFWQGAMDGGLKLIKLEPVEIIESGDIASDTGVLTLTAPADGGTTEIHAQYIVVWKQVDGNWYLHRDIWNVK